MSGLPQKALRPLMLEKNEEVRQKAIQKISEDLKGKQHAGRGHKKKVTTGEVKIAVKKARYPAKINRRDCKFFFLMVIVAFPCLLFVSD